jgi:hypothetical protein
MAMFGYLASLFYGKFQEELGRRSPAAPPPAIERPAPAPQAVPDPGLGTIAEQERQLGDLGRGRVNIIETNARRHGQLSSGTAWSVGNDLWASARHVVEDCERLQFAGGPWRPVTWAGRHRDADVAAVRAGFSRPIVPIAAAAPQPGTPAFAVGYPQRQAGVMHLRLRGVERVKLAGRIGSAAPFRAYVWQVERYPKIRGGSETVGGISGGPVIDRNGQAVGVAIFEAPRRQALGSVSLSDLKRTLGPTATPSERAAIDVAAFDALGRRLLESGAVIQVLCR